MSTVILAEAVLEIGARVVARGGVALEVDEVAAVGLARARQKWLNPTSYSVANDW